MYLIIKNDTFLNWNPYNQNLNEPIINLKKTIKNNHSNHKNLPILSILL